MFDPYVPELTEYKIDKNIISNFYTLPFEKRIDKE